MEIYLLHNGKSFALQSWFAPPCPTPCSSPSCAIQLAAFHLMQRPKDVRKQGGQDPGTLGSFSQVERRVLNFFARIPFVFFVFLHPPELEINFMPRQRQQSLWSCPLAGGRKSEENREAGVSRGGRSLALPLHLFIFLHSVLFRCAQDVWYTGTAMRRHPSLPSLHSEYEKSWAGQSREAERLKSTLVSARALVSTSFKKVKWDTRTSHNSRSGEFSSRTVIRFWAAQSQRKFLCTHVCSY